MVQYFQIQKYSHLFTSFQCHSNQFVAHFFVRVFHKVLPQNGQCEKTRNLRWLKRKFVNSIQLNSQGHSSLNQAISRKFSKNKSRENSRNFHTVKRRPPPSVQNISDIVGVDLLLTLLDHRQFHCSNGVWSFTIVEWRRRSSTKLQTEKLRKTRKTF